MYAAVELLYQEGRRIKPPALMVGQIETVFVKGKPAVHLWPLDFHANVRDSYKPQAVLWQPEFIGMGSHINLRGLELVERGMVRRWCAQRWVIEIVSNREAEEIAKTSPRIRGLIHSAPVAYQRE